jgi:hypothetical protein
MGATDRRADSNVTGAADERLVFIAICFAFAYGFCLLPLHLPEVRAGRYSVAAGSLQCGPAHTTIGLDPKASHGGTAAAARRQNTSRCREPDLS